MMRSPAQAARAVSPWLWVLGFGGLLTGAVVGLVLAGAPLLARIELTRSLQSLSRYSGFEISVDRVSIDLRGSLVLEGVRAEDWQGTGIRLAASRLRTRIHAGALLRGASHTADLDLDDLRVTVTRPDALQAGVGWSVLARLGRLARTPGLAGPWRVAFEGAFVEGLDDHGGVAWTAGPIRALVGRPTNGAPAGGEVVATLALPGHPVQLSASLSLDAEHSGRLQVTADRELPLGPLPGVVSRGFAASNDTLQLNGVRIDSAMNGVAIAGVARAVVLRSRYGSIPRHASDVAAVSVHGLDADARVPGTLGPWLLAAASGGALSRGAAPQRLDVLDASLRVAGTSGDARLTLEAFAGTVVAGESVTGEGHVELAGLNILAPWLSRASLGVPTVAGKARLAWPDEGGGNRLSLEDAQVGALSVALAARYARGAGWTLGLTVPQQPCNALAGALPAGLLSVLRPGVGPVAEGRMAGTLTLRVPDEGNDEVGLAFDGQFDCVPTELEQESERRIAGVVKTVRSGEFGSLPALRSWIVALLAPHVGRERATVQDPATRLSPSASPVDLPWRESALEGVAAAALPPGDGTIASRLDVAWAALRLASLLDPDEIALLLAENLRVGGAKGLRSAAQLLGKLPSELTAVDVAYLVVASRGGALPDRRSPLDGDTRHQVAEQMRELMLEGAITPEEFVGAAPYDPFTR